MNKMELIEFPNIFFEKFGIILEIEDWDDGWHDSVRDWIEIG
jgi:hypothetical protein